MDLRNLGAEGDGGEGRFAGLELGPPDISIRNVEARTYFFIVLFLGGRGEGGGGWLGAKRPSDTRDHHDMTLVRLHLRMQTNLYVLPCPCFPCNN